MEYIKPPTSHLSRHGTLVNFGAVQEIANKNKVVRFEGIEDNKSVADTANNNIEKTKRKPIGRQKRKDKIRRSQARKEKIRMQLQEEEAEEMRELSWENFCCTADEICLDADESEEKKKGLEELKRKVELGVDHIPLIFNALRDHLIRNNKYVFFGYHLARASESELQKIEEAKFPGGGTDEQSLTLSSDSDTLKVVEVVEPTGFDKVLDHSFVSNETKQKLKELMGSVLTKKQKKKALQLWLFELAFARLNPRAPNPFEPNPFEPFYKYVNGDGFDPNAIVDHFTARDTALSSVDQSSGETDSDSSSISSITIVGVQYVQESDDTITEN